MTSLLVTEALSRIEAELTAFWSAPDEQSGQPMPKVRSSTMTYAVVTNQSDIERAREATESIVDTHPGRAFVLTVDGRLAPWEMKHDVRMACRLDGGAQPICHDWLELTFGAMACERAGSILETLSLPEIPVVIEVGRGASRAIINAIAQRADRLIVDSAHTQVSRIAEVTAAISCPIGDRQFVRTYTWRELIARYFDDALPALDCIQKVTVGRTAGGTTEPAALLLGWLGSRLGWTYDSQTQARDRQGKAVEIIVQDESISGLGPGEITDVWIETRFQDEPFSLACNRRRENPTQVCWLRSGAKISAHEHALGRRGEDWVLVKAIDGVESDRTYREALTMAASWSGQ